MGEVFLAEDTTLGRKVAIKMLPERSVGSAPARQRLINEAKAAAALDHPNICAIHEVGEDDDCVFIVMQYIDGESLAERIRQRPMPPADVQAPRSARRLPGTPFAPAIRGGTPWTR